MTTRIKSREQVIPENNLNIIALFFETLVRSLMSIGLVDGTLLVL